MLRQTEAIALPGDVLLCPECREPLLMFAGPSFSGAQPQLGADVRDASPGRYTLHCGVCGAGAIMQAQWAPMIEETYGAQALIRSGGWVDWRALGGE